SRSVDRAVVNGLLRQAAQQVEPFKSELDARGSQTWSVDVVDAGSRQQLRQALDRTKTVQQFSGAHELAGLHDTAVLELRHESVEVNPTEARTERIRHRSAPPSADEFGLQAFLPPPALP